MPRKQRKVPWLDWIGETAYVFWYDAARQRTERLSLRTTDPVEAQKRFAAFLAEGHDIIAGKPGQGITVHQALDDYWREHVSANVIDKTRAQSAIMHLKEHFKPTDLLRDVDIPASREYAKARREGEVGGGKRRKDKRGGDSTIRRELVVLQAAANHAARWKRIGPSADPPVPMPSIELPPENTLEAITDDEWLTRAEYKLAVEKATGKLRDFIILTYDSASRRRAIEFLTVKQVDLRNSRVNLTNPAETTLQRLSKKRRPVVPIGPDARPVYERLLLEADGPYLFGTPTDMYRPFREHLSSLGLAHKSNPHILRHSRATHLLQDGVDIWFVAKLLGDTVATVEKVYGHHCPNFLAATIEAKQR
jgi:integrase